MPVHVTLDWPAGTPTSTIARVHIQAVRTAGPPESDNLASEADAAPDGAVLNLGEGVWQVQASAPGYWSQHADITIASQAPANVQIAMWPAASLHGQITTSAGEPLPHSLLVRLIAIAPPANKTSPQVSAPQSQPNLPNADLLCQIDKGTWSCLGPAGLFDMELESPGYTPRYVWGVNLKAAENDLGPTVLRRAASIFGRAVMKDGSDPSGPCQAILQPDLERGGPQESDAVSALSGEREFTVPLSHRGYFQIVGMMPGKHVLMVKCPAASGFLELNLESAGETQINPPLRLQDLTLDIAVTPKVDPAGQPWQFTVDMTAPLYRRVANRDATSADGHWLHRGLMSGNYHISVNSSDGTLWLQQYFDLNANSTPISLHLLSAKVAGRVSLGSIPVRAKLVFTNDAGGQSVTLQSDNNGRFQGVLPVTDVQATSWTVEAHVAQPPVTQQLLGVNVPVSNNRAWLDLDLPAIAVHGSVVSPNGKPQQGAQVTCEDSNGIRNATSTDDAGNFEMPDLSPGKYTAVADSQDGSSDRTPFEVTANNSTALKLVLNPFRRVRFNVVSSDGPVTSATVQVWINPGVPRAFLQTDQNGNFEVSMPPGISEVGLTVGAPGYAIKLLRLQIPSENDDSSDANTITLDNTGGTLVLNFQPPDSPPDNSSMLYLVHNGTIQDARTLSGWGTSQAGTNGDGPATVDSIEPGKYALCALSDATQVTAIWSGALPPDRCRSGSLDQGETLTLSPPVIAHAPVQSSTSQATQ